MVLKELLCKNNPKAIDFYKRQGYGILGEVDFPMETNTYVNLVMNKKLKYTV